MNPLTNGAIAIWVVTHLMYLGTLNTLAAAADKQYYNNYSLMAAAQETGLNGTVNAQELNAIFHLRYPQQYNSIIRRFGMPYSRDRYRDFYKIAGARNWVAIEYDGRTAVGYIIISDY
jgi:hypothetical protein